MKVSGIEKLKQWSKLRKYWVKNYSFKYGGQEWPH